MKLNENNYCKKCDDKWPMRAGKRGPAALEWEVVPCWDTRGRMHCAQGGWGGGRSAVVGRSTLGRVGAKRRSPGHGVTRGRLRRLSRHRSWGRVGLA